MQVIPASNIGKSEVASVVNKSGRGQETLSPGPRSGDGVVEPNQPAVREERAAVTEEEVIKAIERANKSLEGVYTQFEFTIHEKTREIMVRVIDRETGELIREIPPEKILDLIAKMWELAGILVDEKV
ncbi:MAG TPA: flagellar protein FlaG [Clostridia bacterium]|nr:flagellar protein FlaG [Clostridia bacterium]